MTVLPMVRRSLPPTSVRSSHLSDTHAVNIQHHRHNDIKPRSHHMNWTDWTAVRILDSPAVRTVRFGIYTFRTRVQLSLCAVNEPQLTVCWSKPAARVTYTDLIGRTARAGLKGQWKGMGLASENCGSLWRFSYHRSLPDWGICSAQVVSHSLSLVISWFESRYPQCRRNHHWHNVRSATHCLLISRGRREAPNGQHMLSYCRKFIATLALNFRFTSPVHLHPHRPPRCSLITNHFNGPRRALGMECVRMCVYVQT